MKLSKIKILIISLIVVFSCKNEKEFDYPLIQTGEVTDIDSTSAVFHAKISNFGNYPITESGFVWGINKNPDTNSLKLINPLIGNDLISLKTNEILIPNKVFYARSYAKTAKSITYGNEVNFKSVINDDTSHWSQIIASLQQEQSIYIDLCFTIDGKVFFLIDGYPNYNLFSLDLSKLEFKHILTKNNTSNSEFHYSFIYNNIVYIFLDNSLYTFNPINYNFSKVSDFIGTSRYLPISFVIEGNFYYGFGYSRDSMTSQWEFNNDFWKYNINSNQWFKLSPFPGESGGYRLSLGSKNGGYIGCKQDLIKETYTSDFWYYNPIKNNWTKKASLPCSISSNGSYYTICGFLTNNKFYCYYDKKTYEYNPSFDYWIKLQDLETENNINFPCAFSIENIEYIANIMYFSYNETYYLNLWKFVQ